MRLNMWCVAAVAVALGGCSTTGSNGPNLASLPGPVSAPVEPAPTPAPIAYGAFLEGPVGARLPDVDRTTALRAEDGALASGQRRTWKGSKGIYGFVVPGPVNSGGPASTATTDVAPADGTPAECRSFTHTIYFAGRPQTGKGTGCRDAGGTWHVTS